MGLYPRRVERRHDSGAYTWPPTATEAAGSVIHTTGETTEGSAPNTDAQVAELMAGIYYFNAHTEKFPDGEIRGQLALMQYRQAIQHVPVLCGACWSQGQ